MGALVLRYGVRSSYEPSVTLCNTNVGPSVPLCNTNVGATSINVTLSSPPCSVLHLSTSDTNFSQAVDKFISNNEAFIQESLLGLLVSGPTLKVVIKNQIRTVRVIEMLDWSAPPSAG